MAYSLCKIYGSMHSARVIYYAIYTQHTFRKVYSLCKIYISVHSERVIHYAIYTQHTFRKGDSLRKIYISVHSARRRGERGKTHSPFKKHYQIENEKYINE